MRVFYDHIVELHIGELIIKLEEFDISNEDRDELLALIDSMLHHRVMDLVLSLLEREEEEAFLASFTTAPHNVNLLEFLKEREEAIEEKIETEAKKLKEEILYEVLSEYKG